MNQFNRSELSRYIVSGVIVVIVDYCLLNLAYLILDLPILTATLVSFVPAALFGYWQHSRWTFRYDTRGQHAQKIPQFLILSGLGLALTELIMHLLTVSWHVNYNLSKAVAIVLVTALNFTVMKWGIFKQK